MWILLDFFSMHIHTCAHKQTFLSFVYKCKLYAHTIWKHTFPYSLCLCLIGRLQLCEVLSGPFDRHEEWGLKGWWAVPKLVTHSDHRRWSGTGLPTAWLWVWVEGPLEKGQGVSGSPPSNTGWGTFHKAGLCDLASGILLVWCSRTSPMMNRRSPPMVSCLQCWFPFPFYWNHTPCVRTY